MTVRFADGVEAEIRSLAALDWDGLEMAFPLYGDVGDRSLTVRSVERVAIPEEDRTGASVTPPIAAWIRRQTPTLRLVGEVHSHPRGNRVEPSPADIKGWRAQRARLRLNTYLGLIVGRHADDWSWHSPLELRAWTITSAGVRAHNYYTL